MMLAYRVNAPQNSNGSNYKSKIYSMVVPLKKLHHHQQQRQQQFMKVNSSWRCVVEPVEIASNESSAEDTGVEKPQILHFYLPCSHVAIMPARHHTKIQM